MSDAKPGNFTGDAEHLASIIVAALESKNDTRFDPFCDCGKDTLLDQHLDPFNNSCECWIDRSYDLGFEGETYGSYDTVY
ncbi:MAG TPA: hypothetical protein VFT87_05675 [Candidatus Saccharimonadales bacterium]|nr:hypothetical protein [Candidatus Saccharimonadales bacterium]